MYNDLISVIVPIYNIEQYVGLCIESIIKQTYRNLEIILVDDGSTDRSASICDLYASKDSRIRVIHKENGGLVSARKAGVRLAKGNYIGYVDGDDWIEPDYYESMFRSAVKANADIVCAGYSRDLFNHRVKCINSVLDGIYEGSGLEALYGQMIICDGCFTIGITTYVWNKLFKSDILKQVQEKVDDCITIGEDAAVTYPALLHAKSVYVCDNSSYHYRQHEGSMLKQYSEYNNEVLKIKCMYEYLNKLFSDDLIKEMLINQLRDFTLGYFIMRSGGVLELEESVFGKSIENKKVAIVSAGSFGQMMYKRLMESGYCKVVGWYDEDYWEYRRCCMNIDPLEEIQNMKFDYVLIAKIDQDNIWYMKEKLLDMGINKSKILSIDYKNMCREKVLKSYLGN